MFPKIQKFLIENKFYIAAGAVVLFLANFPTIFGHLISTPDNIFTGNLKDNPLDVNVYYSYFEQVKNNHWLFTNQFTNVHLPYIIFNLFFLVCGLIMKILPFINNTAIYDVIKIIAGILLLLSWVPEAYVFYSANFFPHIAFSFALLLFSLIFFFKYTETNQKKFLLYYAIIGIILATSHLYEIFTLDAIIIIYCLWSKNKKTIRQGVGAILLILPFFLIAAYPLIQPDYYKWGSSILPSPDLLNLIWGFGIYGVIIIINALFPLRNKLTNEMKFLWSSIIGPIILMYSFLPPQRRFISGLQIPIIILSINYLCFLYQNIITPKQIKKFLLTMIILCLLSSLSWIFIVTKQINSIAAQEFPVFIDNDFQSIIYTIKNKAPNDNAVVFIENLLMASFIPRYTNLRPYYSHPNQSLNFISKFNQGSWFINTSDSAGKKYFLKKENIKFIVTSKDIAGDFYSEKIKQGGYFLYVVRPDL